ncbi:multicopper oxidase family protein [soil metagenome]
MNHRIAMLVLSLGCMTACGSTPADPAPVPAFVDTLPQPALLENASKAPGTVEVSLVAGVNTIDLAPGKPASKAWTYNGSVPGPTLVATEGDHVVIHFTNDLPDSTTVHWHGLHLPADQDGSPMDPVAAGASRDYVFDLPAGSAGTYWYHPHPDGKTAEQIAMGLFGALIVRAKSDPLPKGLVDEVLVLHDNRFGADGTISPDSMGDQMNGREGDVLFVNGAVNPTMTLRPGEVRRIRIVNASAARYYLLNVPDHQLVKIGSSGGLFGTPQAMDRVLVSPGERAEVLLSATAAPGTTTTLKALAYDRGMMAMGGNVPKPTDLDLLAIAYTGEAPMASPVIPDTLREIAPIDVTGAVQRSFVLTEQMMDFMINGKVYDPMRVDVRAKLGATEVWTVKNSADMDHPFHLHGFQFQVLDRNGAPEPVIAWDDTVNLPKKTSVRLAVKLADFPGMRMYHCHIAEHEDLGMMGTLVVE